MSKTAGNAPGRVTDTRAKGIRATFDSLAFMATTGGYLLAYASLIASWHQSHEAPGAMLRATGQCGLALSYWMIVALFAYYISPRT